MLGVFLTFALVELTTPHGHIFVNPREVTSIREPYGQHFGKSVRCVLVMTNGKFTSLADACDEAYRKLEKAGGGR